MHCFSFDPGPDGGSSKAIFTGFGNDQMNNTALGTQQLGLPFNPNFRPPISVRAVQTFPAYDAGKIFHLYATAVYAFWREPLYGPWQSPIIVADTAFERTHLRFIPEGNPHAADTKSSAAWAAYDLLQKPFDEPFDERSWAPKDWEIIDSDTGSVQGRILSDRTYDSPRLDSSNDTGAAVETSSLSSRDTTTLAAPVPIPADIHTTAIFGPGFMHPAQAFELFWKNLLLFLNKPAVTTVVWPQEARGIDFPLYHESSYGTSMLTLSWAAMLGRRPPSYIDYMEGLLQILAEAVRQQRYQSMKATITKGSDVIANLEFHAYDQRGNIASAR